MIAHCLFVGCIGSWLAVGLLAQQAPPTVEAPVRLAGRVVRSTGEPIAGAVVAFAPAEARTTAQWLAEPPLQTGADGRFALTAPARAVPDDLAPPVLIVVARGFAAIQLSPSWKYGPKPPDGGIATRLDTDVGDLVLPEGTRLFGRVRDAQGKGLAGVSVVASDLFDHHGALPGTPTHARCRAVSDASGIFALPAALPMGVVLEVAHEGHYRRTLRGVGAGTPIEIEMVASAAVRGRVVDALGAPVAGAIVAATYERPGNNVRVPTGADGSFTVPIEHEGRFRVVATRRTGAAARQYERAESAVLDGPTASLELAFEKAAATALAAGKLRVQVTDADGKGVSGLRVAAIWNQHALQNPAYLDYLLDYYLHRSDAPAGEVTVDGPGEGEPRTGAIAVIADGCAPHLEREYEWREFPEGTAREPWTVKLQPESTVSGRVVDERTGEPIAGVRIWSRRKQDPSAGRFHSGDEVPDDAVTSGADGAFTVRRLGEGDWTLSFRHAERPKPPSVDVAVKKQDHVRDVVLRMAPGARVGGRLQGITLPAGAHAVLCPIDAPRLGNNMYWYGGNSGQDAREGKVPIASDGTFEFQGKATRSYFLVVEIPSAPRCGEPVYLPIEPLRVTAGGVQRDFAAGTEQLGRIAGRLVFPKAVPEGALPVVVAQEVPEDGQQHMVHYGRSHHPGPRAFVKADGSFTLALAPGRHRLTVVDAVLGLQLAELADPVVVKADGESACEIQAPLHEVVVRLQSSSEGTAMSWLSRLEVRHEPEKKPAGGGVMFGGNQDDHDAGSGLPVPVGTTSLRLWLPAGKVTLLARGDGVRSLQKSRQNRGTPPLARDEFDLASDQKAPREVTLTIGAAPAIEPPAETPKGSDDK